ncbi:MAG TPA: hypothetical protein VHN37_05145 [Actinomycetota bacterium]|nr:hypothetical protein [Actinomycetota bacterium]
MKTKPQQFDLFGRAASGPWEEHDLDRRADFQAVAVAGGHEYKAIAFKYLTAAGARIVRDGFRVGPFPVDAEIMGPSGNRFLVLMHGTPDAHAQSGLRRVDTLEKAGFFAMQLRRDQELPILLLTSDLPYPGSRAAQYLAKLSEDVWDVIATRGDLGNYRRLSRVLRSPDLASPPDAPWRDGSMTTRAGTRQRTLDLKMDP